MMLVGFQNPNSSTQTHFSLLQDPGSCMRLANGHGTFLLPYETFLLSLFIIFTVFLNFPVCILLLSLWTGCYFDGFLEPLYT